MTAQHRFGIGYDIHRLVRDRPLILGGVEIDHDKGLLGHSDGDVVLHAVTDALLGAAGMGDIGELFPDTDARYKDADSKLLLADVVNRVQEAGYSIGNVDLIIHAERPNLSAHKVRIRNRIADILHLPVGNLNVKAKTNEGLGPVGTREGVACTAIASLMKIE